jgi:hypothetical protein
MTVMTPGQGRQHDAAGALELAPGALLHGPGPRPTTALFRALRRVLEAR